MSATTGSASLGGHRVLVTAQGVGAVAGALALAWPWPNGSDGGVVLRGPRCSLCRCCSWSTAWPPACGWSSPAFMAVGAGYIAVLSGLNTVVQLRAPVPRPGVGC